jgi:RNA polymerase-associated protein
MAVVSNKRSVMNLYSDPQSAYSHRVRMVLAEKNITVEIVDVDPLNLPDEVMDFNPYGTLPTLVDRDLKLYESRIIMEYLDERFPHPPLLPVDPVSRANSRLFLYRVERDWYSLMDRILAGSGNDAAKARKELRESLIATTPIFDAKPFFMCNELSLVDCAVTPLLWRLPALGIELPPQAKAVTAYAQRMFERDSFLRSLSEYEEEELVS